MKVILASQNKGKMNEVKSIFKGTDFQIYSLYDLGNKIDVEETGNTFYDNALIKAKTIYDIYKEPVFADDSGLEIEQLDGRPGVYSARYAGEGCSFADNNMKVISELWNLPEPHKAKFVSTAIFYDGKNIVEAVGELNGQIIMEQRGTEGFGYDPIFIPDGYNTTIAEMSFDEKNKISHRAKSFNKLKEKLMQVFQA
jgi:XTP/dITP diphosphohydrolase